MATRRLGIFGLALGHPMGFAEYLSTRGFTPVALCADPAQEEEVKRTAILQGQYPDLRLVPDSAAMLAAGVDAIVCSSQSHRHLADCRPFIEARIPLFIDKPLSPNYADARAILDLVAQYDAPMMSCSVRLFSENYRSVFELIRSGQLGTVLFAEGYEPHGCPPGYWQDVKWASGGLVVNYGVHVVDPLVAALGTDVESVHAVAAKNVFPTMDSEDTAVMTMRFASGAIAIGKVSGGYHFGTSKAVPTVGHLIVHASEAAVETFIDETDVKVYRGGNYGVNPGYHHRAGDYATLDAFLQMVETGRRPVSIAHMDAVMKILDGARRSIDTGEISRFSTGVTA